MSTAGLADKHREPWTLTPGLAWADLKHEWVLTLCMVLAVAAVLGPLLILFGLKHGTIQTMRDRLVQDPRNREIRPMDSRSFSNQWFQALLKDKRVAFVAPSTRQIANTVAVSLPGGKRASMDLLPTGPGDPLLLENGAPVPAKGGCVLSAEAARVLGAKAGDVVTARTKRRRGGRLESQSFKLKVAGVLDTRAGSLSAVYVGPELLAAVESYKDGRAVPALGWPGSLPEAYPVFDGVVVVLAKPMQPTMEARLINNTGFTRFKALGGGQAREMLGLALKPGLWGYLLTTSRRPVGMDSVKAVVLKLRGRAAWVLPWVKPFPAKLTPEGGKPREITLAAMPTQQQGQAGSPFAGAFPPAAKDDNQLLVPDEHQARGKALLEVRFGQRAMSLPVSLDYEAMPGHRVLASARLAGMLNLLKVRRAAWDRNTGKILLARQGYAGFRLYVKTIDDVAPLKVSLEKQGISVHTQAERIRDVNELDGYLSLIFWLIAAVAAVGGAAALAASLYASVQRKQRELGVLSLLGLSGRGLVSFPVYQALGICLAGFGAACVFYFLLSWLIDLLFASHLRACEKLCRLQLWHVAAALGAVLGIGLGAASLAALRVRGIDPAEALRDE